MKVLSLAVACALLVGCKSPEKEFKALADQACACEENDAACGTKVLADVGKFTAEHSADGSKTWVETGVRLNDCLTSTGVKPAQVTTVLAQLGH